MKLNWRRGPDMPLAMSSYIQAVEIDGIVYVGGGGTDNEEDDYRVMAYNTQSCQWHTLPSHSTKWFAMTSVNQTLVLVGGRTRYFPSTSKLSAWQPDSVTWTRPFPPVSMPRSLPSATTYKHWLVVAGGHYDHNTPIEILHVTNMQWSTRQTSPTPWKRMKSATIGDTWYLMGGGEGIYCKPNVYSISLEAMATQPEFCHKWKKLPSLSCTDSCPVNINGCLSAVGGYDTDNNQPVSTILCFQPETDTWVQTGDLQTAKYHCTCFIVADQIYVMGGSDGNTKLKETLLSIKL